MREERRKSEKRKVIAKYCLPVTVVLPSRKGRDTISWYYICIYNNTPSPIMYVHVSICSHAFAHCAEPSFRGKERFAVSLAV